MSDKPHIIIDMGSALTKVGFSGETTPRLVFDTQIGYPKVPGILMGANQVEYFIGAEAEEKRGILKISQPVIQGIIEDWDDIEKILDYIFTKQLQINPEEHNILLTETPLNPKNNREKLTSILFDTFNVAGLYLLNNAVAALQAAGKSTGVVVDIGDSVTHIVPIFDGYAMSHSIIRSNLAGKHLTDYFSKILSERGYHLTTHAEQIIVKEMIESTGYVALNFDAELTKARQGVLSEVHYKLPDGELILLGSEQFRAPEALFKPSLLGKEFGGIHEQVYTAISKTDPELRDELYQNIILSGGSAAFNGLAQRLEQELTKIAPSHNKVKVNLVPQSKYATWLGGSMSSSAQNSDDLLENMGISPFWLTKSDYQEIGPSIVHSKCL